MKKIIVSLFLIAAITLYFSNTTSATVITKAKYELGKKLDDPPKTEVKTHKCSHASAEKSGEHKCAGHAAATTDAKKCDPKNCKGKGNCDPIKCKHTHGSCCSSKNKADNTQKDATK